MKTSGNTVLITGGATGIGFALAEALVKEGNTVIICGRRKERLKEAQEKIPGLHVKKCDVSSAQDRAALHEWVVSEFPPLNVLINNAGIQRTIDLKEGAGALHAGGDEVEINLKAPIELIGLFMGDLLKQKEAAIVNVSSGLAFVPMAHFPVYCATKAAMHSYTISLRHQLRGTPVKVFEVAPPAADTGLNAEGRGGRHIGVPATEVSAAAMAGLARDEYEIAVGQSAQLREGAKANFDGAFAGMNRD